MFAPTDNNSTTYKTIGGIVLAGGKSTRMGEDKGLILLNGKRMVEHITETLLNVSEDVLIVANNKDYQELNYNVYNDEIKDVGPIGGIYTGLLKSGYEANFILSCDIPFVSQRLLKYLADNIGDEDVLVIEHHGKSEPLCGIYKKRCMSILKRLITQNKLKVQDALAMLNTRILDVSGLDFITDYLFMNINTKEQLQMAGGLK